MRALTHKPDLVYFTLTPNGMAFYRDVLYVALMKLSGARRIYHLHGKGVDKALTNPLTLALYKWVFRGAEVILLSPSLYADSARVVRREQCHFLANGIPDPWDGRDYRDDRSCRIDTPRIVFFSNLVVNKGIFVLLEALALLKIRGVPFRASFVGAWESASVEQEFGRIVREKALHDLVEVRGPRHGEEKRQAYAEADIMAFPTYNDSYPLVVLEAMSHALPVISTYEGAIPEILADNITGFLVPRMDALTTADRLELLLTDPALRERMGKAGRKRYLSKFTLRHFEENLRNILEKCLAKNK
ncbi:MAG TPA: glycosyltransferase family 4 protein [Nitrospirota bacterium]|nr:glycosyltransferase family 4 protein [Nitrospirota bacterium]